MSIFECAIANIIKLDEPWGIKDKDSKHIFMNDRARVYTNTPKLFSVEGKTDSEFPVDWNELAESFILHDKNTMESSQSVSVIETHKWNGSDSCSPFISTKFPIYNLQGDCIGVLWNAKPIKFLNPFIKSQLDKSVIELDIATNFSRKEQDVIFMLMNGFTRKEIAKILSITIRTVESRIYSFMVKHALTNQRQLRDYYFEHAQFFKIPDEIIKKGVFFYE